jgi:hypothetical protein
MRMQEQAIVTHLAITKSKQVKVFQVRLPKNTIRIIGIETSIRLMGQSGPVKTPVPGPIKQAGAVAQVAQVAAPLASYGEFGRFMFFRRNTFFGDLKLQSCERGNIFFVKDIEEDVNLGFGDFSQVGRWQALPYSHEWKREEDRVVVDGCTTIIQGIYKDGLIQAQQRAYVAIQQAPVTNPDVQVKSGPIYILSLYVWVEIGNTTEKKGAENDSCTCT